MFHQDPPEILPLGTLSESQLDFLFLAFPAGISRTEISRFSREKDQISRKFNILAIFV